MKLINPRKEQINEVLEYIKSLLENNELSLMIAVRNGSPYLCVKDHLEGKRYAIVEGEEHT